MDLAFNPHAERARRKNRSSTNVNHLTLAPLTTKLPIDSDAIDPDATASAPAARTSYLQGKSAPTTPRLLTRSPAGSRSRSHHRTPSAPGAPITKSKSSTHLGPGSHNARKLMTGSMTPGRRKEESLGQNDVEDSDWLLRTGAMMSSEAREFKGQAWLVSRQSSTSLTGMRDAEEEAFERELARERDMNSRRGSSAMTGADDEASSVHASRHASRSNSRSHSLAGGPRSSHLLRSPGERHTVGDSYFPNPDSSTGPDFVNLDEKLEELERDIALGDDDEAAVRRLVRRGHSGRSTWIGNVIGWSLFSVDENEEESDEEDEEEESLGDEALRQKGRSSWSARHVEGISNAPMERLPPPKKDEGGWQDAAWLLSVASKVMF